MMKIKPEELEALGSGINLGLLAKHIVDGFMLGGHAGTRRGLGSEFSQFRSYQPGDDIRQIDWKMFARSDRYYIRESETESSVTIRFFLDNSATMNYEENGISRFKYASLVTAVLATIAFQQGDAIALHIVNNHEQTYLRESRNRVQLNQFMHHLEQAECKGHWPESTKWIDEIISTRSRELWIVCSDLLDGEERWASFTQRGTNAGHEIQFLQILGYNEIHLELGNEVTVQNPESGIKRSIRTAAVRKQYVKNLNQYLEKLEHAVSNPKSELHRIQMDESVRDAIFYFLKIREQL